MLKSGFLVLCFLCLCVFQNGISPEDIEFCLEREFHPILHKYEDEIVNPVFAANPDEQTLRIAFEYAKIIKDAALAADCQYKLATLYDDLDSAVQWILLSRAERLRHPEHNPAYETSLQTLKTAFPAPADSLIIAVYADNIEPEDYFPIINKLQSYNALIEELAKSWIDQISVERTDSLAFSMIDDFRARFPKSQWMHAALQFELHHLTQNNDFYSVHDILLSSATNDPSTDYVINLYRLSPGLRKNLSPTQQLQLLQNAQNSIDALLLRLDPEAEYQILYDSYDYTHFSQKLKLLKAKAMYYELLAHKGLVGDEANNLALVAKPDGAYSALQKLIQSIEFEHNDSGELAELYFWRGRILGLSAAKSAQLEAAKAFAQCLIYGAPRKRYDEDAYTAFKQIHRSLKIKSTPMQWMRKLYNYKGIVFEDITEPAGLGTLRYSRVALADFDNDSFCDILLNGSKLYRNNGDLTFSDVSTIAGLDALHSSGGLFADFNQDGLLDFVTISHAEDGRGEQLMKNLDGSRFASVNERAGNIDDGFPSEGAAWIDPDLTGYPHLYIANYEKWQVRSAYPDFWWENDNGYFTDQSLERGFRSEAYTDNPGQAGRGVAPADFNNDGITDILVTNYRLNRNFFWIKAGAQYYDIAAQLNLHGKETKGYYGHSIGADWGDYDNDGDLDLFIANLAHPRYLEFSDVSMLLRNDGMQMRVIEADTLYYWQFTDVTRAAGITFDELHSDPLWFDADNDGLLDLFITSVYENDRSYLYRNNGDGTFTDVTWLSGARVYNGWGNAAADFDQDGRLDLVVGSGNGTKLLRNITQNANKSISIKPVWQNGEIQLPSGYENFAKYPNSPAFGIRIRLTLKDKKGIESSQIRELRSAKGTTSQNEPVLHFGTGKSKVIKVERVSYETD